VLTLGALAVVFGGIGTSPSTASRKLSAATIRWRSPRGRAGAQAAVSGDAPLRLYGRPGHDAGPESDDVPGLATEIDTLEALDSKIKLVTQTMPCQYRNPTT
jgi:hypothetical protein